MTTTVNTITAGTIAGAHGYNTGVLFGSGDVYGNVDTPFIPGDNVLVFAVTGGGIDWGIAVVGPGVAQRAFDTVSFTDKNGVPHIYATADATSFDNTGADTYWFWHGAGTDQGWFTTGQPYALTFNKADAMPPTITQAAPVAEGSLVTLSWTAAVGSGGDAGTYSAFSVLRNGVTIAAGLAAGATSYIDSSIMLGDEMTYVIHGTYSVIADSPVISNSETICADVFNCDCESVSTYDTLANVRTKMLIRLGYPNQATNPPPGMATLIDQFLRDAQDEIYMQLQRAALRTERFFRWTMVPGQRYYGLTDSDNCCDAEMNPYKVTWVGFEDLNAAWYRLDDGIPPEYYTRANINFGWPTRYEIRSCIEIFPAPQAAYTLWVKGDFGLAALVADDDRFTIDDKVVFLLALGNAKAHYGQKDAQLVLTQAGNYTRAIVAGSHGTRRYVPRSETDSPLTPPKFLPLGSDQA